MRSDNWVDVFMQQLSSVVSWCMLNHVATWFRSLHLKWWVELRFLCRLS